MAAYRPESTVPVRPFAQRPEGDEVVIGDLDRQVFLAIPREGVDILESLAAGATVGETVRRFQDTYGETPDIDAFLEIMAAEGFVGAPEPAAAGTPDPAAGASAGTAAEATGPDAHGGHTHRIRGRSWSLDWIAPAVARRLTGVPVLVACFAIIAAGVGTVVSDPGVLPSTQAFMFPGVSFALFMTLTFVAAVSATFVHELAHATVARAAGVPVTLGFSNLLYIMVAQTDVSGLRMAPKRQRYLAFLAGAIVDLVFASLLVFLRHADRRGAIDLPPAAEVLTAAVLLTYLFRVMFQCNVTVRTDMYYVLATAFNSNNLLANTETMMRNAIYRVLGLRRRVVDQRGLPRRERRGMRVYALAYLVGRLFAYSALVMFFVPLIAGILYQFFLFSTGRDSHMSSIDFLVAAVIAIAIDGGGIVLWLRMHYLSFRRRLTNRAAARTTGQPATATT